MYVIKGDICVQRGSSTLGIMTLSCMTFGIMTFNRMTLDTECCYAEFQVRFKVMLSVVMFIVVMPSVVAPCSKCQFYTKRY